MRRLAPLALLLFIALAGLWLALRRSAEEPQPGGRTGQVRYVGDGPAPLAEGAPWDHRLAPAPGSGAIPRAPEPESGTAVDLSELEAVPEDPVERGPATLALTVLSEATAKAQGGSVALWRLGAPGNAHWLPGDQQQVTFPLVDGVGEVGDLPEGSYRAVLSVQRGASDDPLAFEVRAPRTAVTLRIPLPRDFPGSLRLLDEQGSPLGEASLVSGSASASRVTDSPAWVRARGLRDPERYFYVGRGGGWASGGRSHPVPIRAEGGVFAVGTFAEPSKTEAPSQRMRVLAEGRNETWFTLGRGATGPTTFLSVALPLSTILRRLTLPDGSPVLGSTATVTAICNAVIVTDDMPPDRWKLLPVHVRVSVPGYETLEVFADALLPEPSMPRWVRTEPKPAEDSPEAPR